jgi:hypothetical protein
MNDLEKEFVPYQQSLDMKELGFNELCFGYYENGTFIFCYDSVQESELLLNCTAPLYQQAFRFFREKYKIRFFLQSGMSDLGEFFKVIFPDGEQRGVSYPIYEEAELECLKKLIEIAKSGSLKA